MSRPFASAERFPYCRAGADWPSPDARSRLKWTDASRTDDDPRTTVAHSDGALARLLRRLGPPPVELPAPRPPPAAAPAGDVGEHDRHPPAGTGLVDRPPRV